MINKQTKEILLQNNACYYFTKAFELLHIEYYIEKQGHKPCRAAILFQFTPAKLIIPLEEQHYYWGEP